MFATIPQMGLAGPLTLGRRQNQKRALLLGQLLGLCFITLASGACHSDQTSNSSPMAAPTATMQPPLNNEEASLADLADESISLFLFDDDEAIVAITPQLMINQAGSTGDEVTIPEDYIAEYYIAFAEDIAARALQNPSPNEEAMGLIGLKSVAPDSPGAVAIQAPRSPGSSPTKGLIRRWESAQDSWRRTFGGENYKETYFHKAIDEKRLQAQDGKYSAFDLLPGMQSKLANLGDLPVPTGKVYLGMLPDEDIITAIRKDLGNPNARLEIISMIEDFELKRATHDMKIDLPNGNRVDYAKNRYQITYDVDGGSAARIGISKLTQYSTPDRTMMTREVLAGAIDQGLATVASGKHLFVHCKSGKGRSATVVVGIRTAFIMDTAKVRGIALTKKDIDSAIEEQISQVKSGRSEIGVSLAQKTNLQRVLYERAGLPL